MTGKQTIINGIDVSGCNCFIEKMDFPNNLEGGYYNQNNLCECGVQGVDSYSFFCKDNPNCNYKQLARKERECQRTEQKLTLIRDFITDTQIYNIAHSICDKILKIIDEVNADGRK